MANINYQRKGIRITIVVFGPRQSGKHSFLERLRTMSKMPGEMMSVPEEGGELFSFFASLEPKKVDGVEVHARFLTARDFKGDGTIWLNVLKQADGVVFVADSGPGQEFENLTAQSILNQLFPGAAADTALVFFYNKGDLAGAQNKGQLDGEINIGKKPSFVGNSLTGAGVGEAALATVKAAFARFQKQFAEMGGSGPLDARIGLALAGSSSPPAPAAPQPAQVEPPAPPPAPTVTAPVVAAPAPPAMEPASAAPAPVAAHSKSPSSDELNVVLDTELFDAAAAMEEPQPATAFPAVESFPPTLPEAPQGAPEVYVPPPPPKAHALPSIIVTDLPVEAAPPPPQPTPDFAQALTGVPAAPPAPPSPAPVAAEQPAMAPAPYAAPTPSGPPAEPASRNSCCWTPRLTTPAWRNSFASRTSLRFPSGEVPR